MVDLSQWDFAEQFTSKEAAALIAGIDPREAVGGSPIATRIDEATVKAFIAVARGEPPPPDGLLTRELAITMHPDFVPSIFLDATGSTLHGIETLDRAEIVRWLSAIGAKSVYQFDSGSRLPIDTASPATPTPKETTEKRRARYLDWFTEEERINKRGALQRVFEREKEQNPNADRSNIGKDIDKARDTAKTQKQVGGMFGQLVQVKDGKRQN